MDKGEIPLNIYLDLSKAFDTLDHSILIANLKYYRIKHKELEFFKSYLTNRKQFVDIDGTSSTLLNITTGVPQGSVLGPLLFIIYMNNLSHVSNMFKPIIYAGDSTLTSILSTFDTNSNNNNSDHINSELIKISDWLKLNKLSLNVKKI